MRLSSGPMRGQVLSQCPAYLVNGRHHEDVEGISTEDEDGAFCSRALGKLAYPLSTVDGPCCVLSGWGLLCFVAAVFLSVLRIVEA